jgi:hypothetical protein
MKTIATEGSQAKKVSEPVMKSMKSMKKAVKSDEAAKPDKADEAAKPDEADEAAKPDDDPRVLALLKALASAREARPPPDVRPIKKRSNAKVLSPSRPPRQAGPSRPPRPASSSRSNKKSPQRPPSPQKFT